MSKCIYVYTCEYRTIFRLPKFKTFKVLEEARSAAKTTGKVKLLTTPAAAQCLG